jgi:hypothetical protein
MLARIAEREHFRGWDVDPRRVPRSVCTRWPHVQQTGLPVPLSERALTG